MDASADAGRTCTANAMSGLFRRLNAENAAEFRKAGRDAYDPTQPVELNPVHHPEFRAGLIAAAAVQVAAESAVLAAAAAEKGTN